jgi:serine/threonine protein kinase/formylglycine-generating enzyme required for sulfatase activity
MAVPNRGLLALSDDERREVEAWLLDFDQRWDERLLPSHARKIPTDSSWRLPALAEMVKVDLERQWELGRRVSLESYLKDFPELGSPSDVSADLIQAEYEVRRQFGEPASLDDFARRFPGQADELLRLLEQASFTRTRERRGGTSQSKSISPAPAFAPPASSFRPPSPPEPTAPPSTLGRYKILRPLGAGGMGSVYLAEDTRLGRKVALKVAHLDHSSGQEILERFEREARLLAAIDHPNLCEIYDSGEIDGVYYISMAHVEGQSLDKLIAGKGPLPMRQVAAIGVKLALAMQEVHDKGITHRDIKPSNIMMKRSEKGYKPVIVDFGLARNEGNQDKALTRQDQILGTPFYMAPEQVRGKPCPASDIYALGVILYELLAGQRPFDGPTPLAIVAQILTQAPEPPSIHRPDIDARLEAICLKAIAKDSAERHGSMGELAKALSDYLRSSPSMPSAPPVTGPPGDRRVEGSLSRIAGNDTQMSQFFEKIAAENAAAPIIDVSPKPKAKHIVPAESDLGPESERLHRLRPYLAALVASLAVVVVVGGIAIYISTNRGGVKITVDGPFFAIEIDGVKIQTDLAKPITLRAGAHDLTVFREGAEAETFKFFVRRGHVESLRANYNQHIDEHTAKPLDGFGMVVSYTDNFEDSKSGWPQMATEQANANPNHRYGYRDGVWYNETQSPDSIWGWHSPKGRFRDPELEVVARVVEEQPKSRASAFVYLISDIRGGPQSDERGLQVRIDSEGRLFVEPSCFTRAKHPQGPWVGPIEHVAIHSAEKGYNKILLRVKKRQLEIVVNSVRVCEPLNLDWDLSPALIGLGVSSGSSGARAEFDRIEVREPPIVDSPRPDEEISTASTVLTNTLGMKFVLIPSGTFLMGSKKEEDDETGPGESPQHEVRISRAFYLGSTEVTQGQYRAIIGKNPSHFKGSDNMPVDSVSWLDSIVFCNALSVREGLTPFYQVQGDSVTVPDWKGMGYRLPTEAEWEYACRAGSHSRFNFGDEVERLGEFAWIMDNSEWTSHPVRQKPANEFGLYDIHGNLLEWCFDGFRSYNATPAVDPLGPLDGPRRMIRGGCWYGRIWSSRSACRMANVPDHKTSSLGFRVARNQARAE